MPAKSQAQYAWAAGLFEGEGSFSTQPFGVRASLTMNDHDVVKRFREVVGCGQLYPDGKMLRWQAGSYENVQAIVAMFWEFLGLRRKAKALEVLAHGKLHLGRWSHASSIT